MQLRSILLVSKWVLILIFVSTTSVVQADERLIFNSVESERGSFAVARYLPSVSKSKGTVIFIYGGNATAAPFGNELKLDSFGKIFLSRGYALVIPDYRNYIFRRTPNYTRIAYGTDAQKREDVESEVTSQIMDLKKFIIDYKVKFPNESLILMGHSYGGYLVNLLASGNQEENPIEAYISSHGIWGPFDSGVKFNSF
ncbi:MAG: hypothetical protein JNM24_00515 [Bdellovibrionaceae bacterium]|nr:hypothetical protein [Pseudobdellovibrionaceae bacterium]